MAEVSHSKFKSVLPLGTVENTVDKEALDPESEGWHLKSIICQLWDFKRHLSTLSHNYYYYYCKSRIEVSFIWNY